MPIFDVEHPDGRKFEVDAPNMNAAVKAVGGFGQAKEPATMGETAADVAKSTGISAVQTGIGLGTMIPDLREAAASGIGSMTGADPATVSKYIKMGLPFVPGVWGPTSKQVQSAIESQTGEFYKPQTPAGEVAYNATPYALNAIAPGGVLQRAANVAIPAAASEAAGQQFTKGTGAESYARAITGAVTPMGMAGVQRAYTRYTTPPGTAPMSVSQIEDVARNGYEAMKRDTREVPIRPDALKNIGADIKKFVNENGPRSKTADEAHAAIDKIKNPSGAGDFGDLFESRKQLARIAREGTGDDKAAAAMARDQLDARLETVFPGINANLKAIDKNYAIASKTADLQQAVKDAIAQAKQSGTGGNIGNKIRQAVDNLMILKGKEERLSPAVLTAAKNVTEPGAGTQTLRALSAFDPTHSKLGLMFATAAGTGAYAFPPSAAGLAMPTLGFGARMGYDRLMKNRATGLANAMLSEAPASLAQPGYRPPPLPLPPLQYPASMGLAPTIGFMRNQ